MTTFDVHGPSTTCQPDGSTFTEPSLNNDNNTNNSSSTWTTCSRSEAPCDKYKQFLSSSHQERTVVISKLVEMSAEIIDSIWRPPQQYAKVMSTRNFIHEILKRSKTTFCTLQVSLFYLFRVKNAVHDRIRRRRCRNNNSDDQLVLPPSPPSSQSSSDEEEDNNISERLDDLMCCGRRMFLASLMVASKYLHDKNYRNKAWAKISGLGIQEINAAEMAFLRLIDYKLHVSKPTFDKWYTMLHGYMQKRDGINPSSGSSIKKAA